MAKGLIKRILEKKLCWMIFWLIFSVSQESRATLQQTSFSLPEWAQGWKQKYPLSPTGKEAPSFYSTTQVQYTTLVGSAYQTQNLLTLGPLKGSGGTPLISKSFKLNPLATRVTLVFFFVHQGLWPSQTSLGAVGHQFIVFLNDQPIIKEVYTHDEQGIDAFASKSRYTFLLYKGTPQGTGYPMGVYKYVVPLKINPLTKEWIVLDEEGGETPLKIPGGKPSLEIGFGSTLPLSSTQASYGISQLSLKQEESRGCPPETLSKSPFPKVTVTVIPIPEDKLPPSFPQSGSTESTSSLFSPSPSTAWPESSLLFPSQPKSAENPPSTTPPRSSLFPPSSSPPPKENLRESLQKQLDVPLP